jgi:hypothetical protein
MRSPTANAVLLIVTVWVLVGGIRWWANSKKTTPESLMTYVDKHPMNDLAKEDREKVLEKTAKQINALDYEQRREMRLRGKLDSYFKTLNPDEQSRFLDLTVPEGFKQMMDALNKMDRDKRQRFVERALKDLRENQPENITEEDRQKFEQDKNAQKIIDQGLKSFYSDASAETKMDLAPLIEEMQRNIQRVR